MITGKTGSGKSVMFRKLIQEQKRFIIFDSIKEYSASRPVFPALYIQDVRLLLDYLERNKSKPFRIVYDPPETFAGIELVTGEKISTLELICKIVYRGLTDVALGIEELGKHETQKRLAPHLYDIICLGRHKQISLFATTQRAAQISTDFKAQVTKFVAFKQHLPNDLKWIGDCIGDFNEAETLRALDEFVYGKPMIAGKHFKEYTL